MISEKRLVSSFTSFWRELLPTGDAFVRTINLSKERFCYPLDSNINATRHDLVNKTGFLLFKTSIKDGLLLEAIKPSPKNFDEICMEAWNYVQRFRGRLASDFARPDKDERTEAMEIAQRLYQYFEGYETGELITLSPEFAGCGFVDNCAGDILAGQTLYEVKAGERSFRLVDVKQLLVYLALNQSLQCYKIHNAGLLNPRMGTFYKIQVNELAFCIAGISSVELFSDVIEFLSSGGVSR